MRKLAILSTDHLEDFFVYDRMLVEPLNKLGWEVTEISWHTSNHDWDQYDVVVVRSTWDYQAHCDAFLDCLRRIDASSAQLHNPLSLIEWNISKQYLKELEDKGVPIVPTYWVEKALEPSDFALAFERFAADELVIKPYVSANADFTYRLKREDIDGRFDALAKEFEHRDAMIQPFLSSIVDDGEYSLFYFDSHYSHAICKQPAAGDFRVQEEHGGELSSIKPSEKMFTLAQQTLQALPCDALYARIDMVNVDGQLCIIEVELIEPSLYFNMDSKSAELFSEIFANKFA
ncbi:MULTISPECIES: hypothetical protein [Alteromonadaceae]|jgi:glutathione synthase/RimK-type ligase-like ATP-grasp enzyme|uniref:Prokaryotic glutathione synthetase ATP-binding domain-containing protein n=1 Tax=Brumicola blandensis TaxID=3075611 RepID=A0AAW8R4R8_9ALTE|nr:MULTISPECIES: hypothetical protein [unclassified Alteromonas]MDT0582163.1 hypothetical protein [Alteromonas sp. W409]MDT0627881.1 hypothetical protein [Alteromonas sp. W364]